MCPPGLVLSPPRPPLNFPRQMGSNPRTSNPGRQGQGGGVHAAGYASGGLHLQAWHRRRNLGDVLRLESRAVPSTGKYRIPPKSEDFSELGGVRMYPPTWGGNRRNQWVSRLWQDTHWAPGHQTKKKIRAPMFILCLAARQHANRQRNNLKNKT